MVNALITMVEPIAGADVGETSSKLRAESPTSHSTATRSISIAVELQRFQTSWVLLLVGSVELDAITGSLLSAGDAFKWLDGTAAYAKRLKMEYFYGAALIFVS